MLFFIVNIIWYLLLDVYGIGFFLKIMKDIRRLFGIMFFWGYYYFVVIKFGLVLLR